jgi:peroxiredoxin
MEKQVRSLALFALIPLVILNINCAPVSSEEGGARGAAHNFTLEAVDGDTVTLSEFRGEKSVLLVFGATWCPYCVTEIPEFKEVYNAYSDGLELLSIDVQESHRKVASFVDKHSIPYKVLLDRDGEVARKYGVRGIPYQVFIDKSGSILYEGPRPSSGIMSLVVKYLED